MPEELFDVVDEEDRVIEQRSRSEVHARKLLHRAVHIFVFNSAGQMLIHKRSPTKDEQPNVWTSSASGHLSAGEDYEQTAHREMEEEIGLAGELQFLHKFTACSETSYEHTALYLHVSDTKPRFDPVEIAEGRYCSLEEIGSWLERSPDEFSTAFRVLYQWFRSSHP